MKTINLDRPGIRASCRPEFLQGFKDQGYSLGAVPYGVVGDHANLYANEDERAVCVALMVSCLDESERYAFIQYLEHLKKENVR